ncbi:phage tail assembly chaperone [Caulobacter henricii]|uniref:Phage tail assembly chaperone n=1 Tax=Caulobacter henricii TaxID=69395 RepID=A0A0P0NXS2_9CAUL|nr:phage tail assembly chaperone [Caulobacter henricii]ALL12582.1 hypothetical protein AQ619_03975 [Caulobacter henricii]
MTGWSQALRLAVSLQIPPEAFWRLSLREWRMLTATAPAPGLTRPGLEALMARFPDEETPP